MPRGKGRIASGRQLPAPRRSFEAVGRGGARLPPTGFAPIRIGAPPVADGLDPAEIQTAAPAAPSSETRNVV